MADEATFLDYFEAMAWRLTPIVAVAYFKALKDLARSINIEVMTRLLEARNIEGVVALMLNEQVTAAALAPMQQALRDVTARAGVRFYKDTPVGPSSATPIARIRFNVLDPNVVTAIERYESVVFSAMTDTLKETVRQFVTAGLNAGVGPREIAKGMREVLGLAPTQEQYLRNYQAELEALSSARTRAILRAVMKRGDTPAVLGRTLSDGNFDRVVRSAITKDIELTPAQIEKGIARYRKNLKANQADTTSRTVTLNAMREAQRMSWDQAIAAGKVAAEELVETWFTNLDGRERPAHHQMHGAQKGYYDDWFVPGVGRQRYPGESEYNCRCRTWIAPRIRRASEIAAPPPPLRAA